MNTTIAIKGMSCQHCKKAVEDALNELGLREVAVTLAEGTASYADNPDVGLDKIREAIEDAGYEVAD